MLEYSYFVRYLDLNFLEVCLIYIYCVKKSVVSKLSVDNVMLHVSRVIIIDPSAELIEYDIGAVVKVHVDRWV